MQCVHAGADIQQRSNRLPLLIAKRAEVAASAVATHQDRTLADSTSISQHICMVSGSR